MVNEDGHFNLREVFYDKDKKIEGWTDECSPFGETFEELKNDLSYMMQALNREVLVESEIMTNIVDKFKEDMETEDDS